MKYIMHVLGPDEEIKFDSEEDALKEANAINASHVIALAGMTEEKKSFILKLWPMFCVKINMMN